MGNLVEYDDSDSEAEILNKDSIHINQALAATQVVQGNSVSNHKSWQDFSKNQASSSNTSWTSIRCHFVEMGYSSTMVEKAISIHGTENWNEILEYLLACKAVDYSLDSSHGDSNIDPERLILDNQHNFEEIKVKIEDTSDGFGDPKETPSNDSQADNIMASLLEMGYDENAISSAIEINGISTPIDELVDFIDAYLCGKGVKYVEGAVLENHEDKKQNGEACVNIIHKRKQTDFISTSMKSSASSFHKKALGEYQKVLKYDKCTEGMKWKPDIVDFSDENPTDLCLKELTGFGVPGKPVGQRCEELNAFIQGPPYFYFENDAFAPRVVWKMISQYFNGVEPEIVDSKHFSATRRLRGYVHNLPIDGRFHALPLPPMTIQEALPQTKKYWPPWDQREKLNCMVPGRASVVLLQELRSIIKNSQGKPSVSEQAYILQKCEQWNLVWVGPDDMATLEPHELEALLGYEKDHTRGVSCRTNRLQCLCNSFQTDTVAYHLSVLKSLYPDGLKVLSLFSGIGGGEVALHRLRIHLKCVVSVEICPKNRLILDSWWQKTQQRGRLIQKEDVQHLTREVLQDLIDMVGGFDLIIGGSPYSHQTSNNRANRDELDLKNSLLFYECPRIVKEVKQIMHFKGMA